MQKHIRMGYIDLSFHAASAALVQRTGPTWLPGRSQRRSSRGNVPVVQRGQVEMLVSAWLPASHGTYLAACKKPGTSLGVIYNPYCIWGVPDYVQEDQVAAIADLLKPDAALRMSRRIQDINAGAGISRFSKAMVTEYALDGDGYNFAQGTEADCFNRFEQFYAEEEWLVMPV